MPKEFIQKLTNLVEANLANEKFGPEELAREAGMSHSNLNRKLKSILNQSVSQFIREIRLKKAKELLENEELTAAEISYRVGFGSASYFNKCFHEYFGIAPGGIRNHEEEEPVEQPVETISQKQNRTKIWMVIAVILLVLVPSTYFLIKSIVKDNIKDKSIAVLPLKYLSEEIEKQYLADGLMSAVHNKLSKIKDLRVVSETSVEQYRESHKSAKEIGREQNVAYLLEGSFQKENNHVRLILRLIKTSNENLVWENKYDRQWNDVFSVETEVAEAVASELQAVITPEEKQLLRKDPTTNLTAYDFYLRGNDEYEQYFSSNNLDTVAMNKARHHFRKALELDSTFALAYTKLADIYWEKYYWKTFLSDNFLDSVIILTSKSIAFDGQCAEAYYLRGAGYIQINKPNEANNDLDNAIKYNPNDWKAYWLRGYISGTLFHDFVGAISNRNEAILRERGANLPFLLNDIGQSLIDIGFSESGIKYYLQALELTEDSTEYLNRLRNLEWSLGNFEKVYQLTKTIYKRDSARMPAFIAADCLIAGHEKEAAYYFEKLKKQKEKSGEIDIYNSKEFGLYLWQRGRQQDAEFCFNQQIKICEESIRLGRWNALQKGAQFDLAEVYAFMGNKGKAYHYLDEVNMNSSFPLWWVTLFKNHPLLDPIRQEPRFQKILKDVEAKYQAEHERVRKWLVEQNMM
jgi:TolB-like protein/AraC-like DNA-binding protein/Tfp pilus assembly protein PilF